MLRHPGIFCSLLAMFFIAGGHWTVLQTSAWARMLHDYSQRSGSLTTAVQQTFDGQHPCALCLAIKAARSAEKKAPATPLARDDVKAKALVAESVLGPVLRDADRMAFPGFPADFKPGRVEAPPVPPPRQAGAAV